jgi:hypothetical protein
VRGVRAALLFLYMTLLFMTASVVRCQSISQVSANQVVPMFPLPRYLEKWVQKEEHLFVSY